MRKYNIEKIDPDEDIKPIRLPYDSSKLTMYLPCPYDKNHKCKNGTVCLSLLNDGQVVYCFRYKGNLP